MSTKTVTLVEVKFQKTNFLSDKLKCYTYIWEFECPVRLHTRLKDIRYNTPMVIVGCTYEAILPTSKNDYYKKLSPEYTTILDEKSNLITIENTLINSIKLIKMKKPLIILALLFTFLACNSNTTPSPTTNSTTIEIEKLAIYQGINLEEPLDSVLIKVARTKAMIETQYSDTDSVYFVLINRTIQLFYHKERTLYIRQVPNEYMDSFLNYYKEHYRLTKVEGDIAIFSKDNKMVIFDANKEEIRISIKHKENE